MGYSLRGNIYALGASTGHIERDGFVIIVVLDVDVLNSNTGT